MGRNSPTSPCNVMEAMQFVVLFHDFVRDETLSSSVNPHDSAISKLRLLGDIPEETFAIIVQGFLQAYKKLKIYCLEDSKK